MKLNIDCIRDLLLVLEDKLQFDEELNYPTMRFNELCSFDRLQSYSKQDIAYSTQMLIEADYIKASIDDTGGVFNEAIYIRLTYSGHQFLETIRPPDVWKETKKLAHKVGSFSFQVIRNIASSVLASILTNI